MLSSTFSQGLPRQRKSLTVQDDFNKIIDAVRRIMFSKRVNGKSQLKSLKGYLC